MTFAKRSSTRKRKEPRCCSVLRSVRKRKKSRRLGAVDVISRAEYAGFAVDAKVEMIRALVPLGLMHVQELLDDEVTELAGVRHARKESSGTNVTEATPERSDWLANACRIRVPRVRSVAGGEIPLRSYEAAREDGQVNDVLLKRVLYGISCRNYEAAAEAVPGAIGLSSSTVSRSFIQASAATLREFQERDLSGEDVVALFLDGKAKSGVRSARSSSGGHTSMPGSSAPGCGTSIRTASRSRSTPTRSRPCGLSRPTAGAPSRSRRSKRSTSG